MLWNCHCCYLLAHRYKVLSLCYCLLFCFFRSNTRISMASHLYIQIQCNYFLPFSFYSYKNIISICSCVISFTEANVFVYLLFIHVYSVLYIVYYCFLLQFDCIIGNANISNQFTHMQHNWNWNCDVLTFDSVLHVCSVLFLFFVFLPIKHSK